MKKSKKEIRKKRPESIVKIGSAYCKLYKEYINIETFYKKKCYTGNHGRTYCKYLEEKQ